MHTFKKHVLILSAMFLGIQLFGQPVNFSNFKPLAEQFTESAAGNLPFVATMGANWSDAYIGQLFPSVPPHFGLGLTTGLTFVAKDALNNLTSTFNLNLPATLKDYGLPLPLLVVDSRFGGIILPFDLGIKIGFLPQFVSDLVSDVDLNYFAFGVDLRYPILQENVVLPGLSVGAGYSYLTTSAKMNFGQQLTLNNVPYLDNNNNVQQDGVLTLSQPKLGVAWSASVIDLKLHLSKNLLIFTPYLGLGASLAIAEVTAGYYSNISLFRPSGNPQNITGQQAANDIKNAGFNQFSINADGFEAKNSVNGWGFRLYGGSSLNLLFFRLDLKALWNINTGAYGLEVGTRFQL